jgi:hypothetical protein
LMLCSWSGRARSSHRWAARLSTVARWPGGNRVGGREVLYRKKYCRTALAPRKWREYFALLLLSTRFRWPKIKYVAFVTGARIAVLAIACRVRQDERKMEWAVAAKAESLLRCRTRNGVILPLPCSTAVPHIHSRRSAGSLFYRK